MKHISVLYNEVINGLDIKESGVYVDCTMGGAGHSYGICEKLSNEGVFIGIDRDDYVFQRGEERLKDFKCEKFFIKSNFNKVKNIVENLNIEKVDGILADLGVSSFQIDDKDRGFSFKKDATLDMRMDKTQSLSAYQVVNEYSYESLRNLISEYGEEKFAGNIAKHILKNREEKNIETTFELVEIIKGAIPKKFHKDKHPAKRTFQGIRIEVNNEIDILEETLKDMIDLLKPKGRLAIITFHSLEDKIVKRVFNEYLKGCTCPREFPICVCDNKAKVKVVGKKVIFPQNEEIENNPRARSAKLRIIEKI